jgi:hypothetical protein
VPRKTTARSASATKPVPIGDRVIALRSEDHSFGSIARELGLGKAKDAFAAFADALATKPAAEQAQLRADENSRLDVLDRRTRKRFESEELDRKLAAISALRQRIAPA